MTSDSPKVFISYSHDSPEHARRVLDLAQRLRDDGVDAQLDQYVAGTPEEGWPRWMLNQLEWANFVLVVCTETYYGRFRGHEEPGRGRGVDWEGNIISVEIYNSKSRTTKFVPVLFNPRDETFIPEPLGGQNRYVLDSEESYDTLYAFLVGQAGVSARKLGRLKTLARIPAEPLRFGTSEVVRESIAKLYGVPELPPHYLSREEGPRWIEKEIARRRWKFRRHGAVFRCWCAGHGRDRKNRFGHGARARPRGAQRIP